MSIPPRDFPVLVRTVVAAILRGLEVVALYLLSCCWSPLFLRVFCRAIGGGEIEGECTFELILRQLFKTLNSIIGDWEHDLFSIILLVKHKYNLL